MFGCDEKNRTGDLQVAKRVCAKNKASFGGGLINTGGEGGIRTRDKVAPVPPFQGGDFNRSSTSPNRVLSGKPAIISKNLSKFQNIAIKLPRHEKRTVFLRAYHLIGTRHLVL